MKNIDRLRAVFSEVDDPKSHINQLHNLKDILLIGIISVICGGYSGNVESHSGDIDCKYHFLCKGARCSGISQNNSKRGQLDP